MGRRSTMVEWRGRHVRPVLSRRRPMARRSGEPTSPQSDGPRNDFLDAAQFFLLRRRLRWLLAGLDLVQYRSGGKQEETSTRPRELQRSSRILEAGTRTASEFSSPAR